MTPEGVKSLHKQACQDWVTERFGDEIRNAALATQSKITLTFNSYKEADAAYYTFLYAGYCVEDFNKFCYSFVVRFV